MIVELGSELVEVTTTYRKRKTIKISVNSDLNVEIVAPLRTSKKYITQLIMSKASWILKQRDKIKRTISVNGEREYVAGETFYVLGKPYTLRVVESSSNKIILFENCILMHIKNKYDLEYKKKYMEKWYKEIAALKLKEIYDKACSIFKEAYVDKPRLYFRKMKARWGSYSPIENKVLLNSELIKVPEPCIEYVIVHELCHSKYRNHKKEFYDFVERFIPDWKERREELNRYINV